MDKDAEIDRAELEQNRMLLRHVYDPGLRDQLKQQIELAEARLRLRARTDRGLSDA